MINSKSVTIDVNRSLCEMLEYEEDELLGRSVFDFVDKENAKIFKKQIKDAKTTKQRSYEIVLRSKSGKNIPTIFNATSQFDKDGKRVGSFAFITDISELKAAEKEISNRLAEKTVLIQEIYHRTKNNMSVISAMLSLESNRTDDIFLKTIFKEMINKIRAMALVHQKLYEVKDLSNIKLNEYIKDLMGLLMRSYYPFSKRVNVAFDMKEVKILLDTAVPLGMVINELVSNIFKHAYPENEKGSIIIKLFTDDEGWINLQLADSGVGFPEDFDPRKDSSMGLTSVFNVVEHQLKGEISVESLNGLAWKIKLRDNVHKERV